MTEVKILKNDAGQRADRFLLKNYPALNSALVCKLIRKKRIKLNHSPLKPSSRLNEGDILTLYLSGELLKENEKDKSFKQASGRLDIIYEDDNIILLDKPVGLTVHEDNEGGADTLINRVKRYLWEKGEYVPENENGFAPALCNRIDRNTGGIVIAAKNAEALRIMDQKIRDREIKKLYLCVLSGVPEPNQALLTNYLLKLPDENRVIVSDKKTPENLTIKTKYTIINSIGSQSLVQAELLTGRTHQIRAQFAHIGHPLMGDGKYGNNRINKLYGYKTQALYSYKLSFDFKTGSGPLSYLNGKEFGVDPDKIWFVEHYYKIKNASDENC